jgi:hypothetical protein
MKALFFILVLAELIVSSCATSKKNSGEYDDLYYSPSDKPIAQKSDSKLLLTDTTVFLSNPKETKTVEKKQLQRDILSIGVGNGLDYGNFGGFQGFGANLTVFPIKQVGIFYATGTTPKLDISTIEYNAGIKFILLSYPTWSTEIVGMYGHNFVVSGVPKYDKVFTGPSFGINENYRYRNFFMSSGVYVPILSEEAKEYRDDIHNNPDLIYNDPFPIRFTIGIGFYFGSKEKHAK